MASRTQWKKSDAQRELMEKGVMEKTGNDKSANKQMGVQPFPNLMPDYHWLLNMPLGYMP